jgi:preprotein translocase subunit SecD
VAYQYFRRIQWLIAIENSGPSRTGIVFLVSEQKQAGNSAENEFREIARASFGKSLAVVVDGRRVNIALIRAPRCEGSTLFTGISTVPQGKRIAASVRAGPRP